VAKAEACCQHNQTKDNKGELQKQRNRKLKTTHKWQVQQSQTKFAIPFFAHLPALHLATLLQSQTSRMRFKGLPTASSMEMYAFAK